MYHYRKTFRQYAKHNQSDKKQDVCTFCNEVVKGVNIIEQGETMFVISNRVSYDIFEGRTVTDHLMIIPKRHVTGFKDFTKKEAAELVQMSAKYEAEGYNVYARGMGNVSRSVLHQHTHLIKTNDKLAKIYIYILRPHLLIKL